MSIARPLDSSGSSSGEGILYPPRTNRIAASPPINPPFMKMQYRPELNGLATNGLAPNSQAQLCMYPPEFPSQSMNVLSKRPLSDSERQLIFRSVRQRTNSGPSMLSSQSSDSVVLSGSSSVSLPDSPNSYMYPPSGLNIRNPYSPASNPRLAQMPESASFERFLRMPVLPSRPALEKPACMQSFVKPAVSNLHSSKLTQWNRWPLVSIDVPALTTQDGMKHKLQELERELLNDNDDDPSLANPISPEQSSQLDEWMDTIQNLLSDDPVNMQQTAALSCGSQDHQYPVKENLSSQASRSQPANHNNNNNITKENQTQSLSSQQDQKSSVIQSHGDSGTSSKKLLVDCATAIAEGNNAVAMSILNRLMQLTSVYGDPIQRLTAYIVDALVLRLGPEAQALQNAVKCKETPTKDPVSIVKSVFEVCPYVKFGYMAANSTIFEAVKEERKVHIIDFEIGQGTQYLDLVNQFAARVGGPPELRITVVEDPDGISHSGKLVGDQLMKHAATVGVNLRFHTMAENAAELQPAKLDCRPGEAVAVNFAFNLHRMPDESVSTKNPRDQLLRLVKGLSPKVVTVVEKDMNANTAPFLPRFMDTMNFFSAAFESLDRSLPRDNRDRINVENCLAKDIVNIIACEGAERTQRYEVAGKWRARMSMAGFSALTVNPNVENTIRPQFEACCSNYKLKQEKGALHFGWLDRSLVVVSAWH